MGLHLAGHVPRGSTECQVELSFPKESVLQSYRKDDMEIKPTLETIQPHDWASTAQNYMILKGGPQTSSISTPVNLLGIQIIGPHLRHEGSERG